MATYLPETYVHVTFVPGEIEINPLSNGGSGRNVPPLSKKYFVCMCFLKVYCQTPDLGGNLLEIVPHKKR